MMNRDWERFGEDIRRTVQDAVDSRDFNRLNQTISKTINGAMEGLNKSLHNTRQSGGYIYRSQKSEKGEVLSRFREGLSREAKVWREGSDLFAGTSGVKAQGVILAVIGYALANVSGLFIIVGIVASLTTSFLAGFFQIAMGGAGLLGVIGIVLGSVGSHIWGRVKRFRTYVSGLEDKEYCEIKEFAQHLGKSVKYVRKDLEKMIEIGWFRQGHMDRNKTCLIASDEAFGQYTDLMERMQAQKEEEKRVQERQAEEKSKISPQVQEIIHSGKEYIERIRRSNEAIPGEEISAKISRMETLIDRIFERVKQNPESIPDIRRLMEYYLPTTVKLLEAYEELNSQIVQGENIISSKKEIENTLDTLNLAFEKLLDSLFQDTAWSVSADISVLHTMLAQEGLTEDDFKK